MTWSLSNKFKDKVELTLFQNVFTVDLSLGRSCIYTKYHRNVFFSNLDTDLTKYPHLCHHDPKFQSQAILDSNTVTAFYQVWWRLNNFI